MATPRVSLLIPAFNRAPFIAAAIGSVLKQTFSDFELLVWDDGSTDHTVEVAEQAAAGDPRVRVVRAAHQGLCATLNAAARQTRGQYLGWLDSDDALAPTALERTVGVLETRPEVGLVYTQHLVMNEAGKVLGLGKRCTVPYSRDALLQQFMTFHFRLMRREAFDAVGGIDESMAFAEDYDLCLKLSETTEVAHLAEPLYFYRGHPQAISARHRLEQIAASREAIERALVRRGLSDEYEISVELVGRFELREKPSMGHSAQAAFELSGPPKLNQALLAAHAEAAPTDHGLVSCLCVTRGRFEHLSRVIAQFLAQSYAHCELIVVYEQLDERARELLAKAHDRVRAIAVPTEPKLPLGTLRNLSLEAARGSYICIWDDDDWHAPRRLELELECLLRSGAEACVLGRWLMLDAPRRRAYLSSARLWEGSLLCRRDLAGLSAGYPPLVRGEDRVLLERIAALHRIAVLDQPELYVYVYHARNTWDRRHFELLLAAATPLAPVDADRVLELVHREPSH